ncbi:MAG: HAD-IA family hydrolase, partial [Candidatus Saccharimonadales bacterium]
MIRAIIFDCFGVLTTDAWLPFKNQHFGHDPELLSQATDLNKQADGGLISTAEFIRNIAELAQMPEQRVLHIVTNNVANGELFELVTELKSDYKIGLLSNASMNYLSDLFTDEQIALFEVTALSYQTNFVKPMAEAYLDIAERLDVVPSECVLIDDQERFVTGAREAGMQAIWYHDNDQLQAELSTL